MGGRQAGRRTRRIAIAVSLVLGACTAVTASAAPVTPTAAFVEGACAFPLSSRQVIGFNVLCGRVSVPERHAAPDGRRIDLAVAVLRSANPIGPPLIYLNGGPAAESGSIVPAMVSRSLTLRRLLQGRDVVVFDQRGVGRSTPSLSCAVETVVARRDTLGEALTDCAARLGRWGVDLGAYNSAENASDLTDLAAALGTPQVDLYGASYGSRLALTAMRDHPGSFRRVILDAPVPLEADLAADLGVSFDRALRRVFAACAAEARCARAYPGLEASLLSAYRRLNRTPVRVRPLNAETGMPRAEIRVNGDAFVELVYGAVFGGAATFVPQLVHNAGRGDDSVLQIVATVTDPLAEEVLSTHGMYLSVMCQEELAFSSYARATAQDVGLLEPVRRFNRIRVRELFGGCASWPVGRTSAVETEAVHSDIPTLILAGRFDPITPPEYAALIEQNLPNSTAVTVPGYGHGTVGLGPCPVAIAVSFLDRTAAAPDTSCAAKVPFSFALPTPMRRADPVPPSSEAAALRWVWAGMAP